MALEGVAGYVESDRQTKRQNICCYDIRDHKTPFFGLITDLGSGVHAFTLLECEHREHLNTVNTMNAVNTVNTVNAVNAMAITTIVTTETIAAIDAIAAAARMVHRRAFLYFNFFSYHCPKYGFLRNIHN